MNQLKTAFTKELNTYGKAGIPCLFIIDFELERPQIWPLDQLDSEDFLYHFNGKTNLRQRIELEDLPDLRFSRKAMAADDYYQAFQKVQAGLRYGDSFLTNLTFPTPIKLNWDLKDAFSVVDARYKLWLKDQFLCFSPEIFIQIKDQQIHSFPMKGTQKAIYPGDEELLLNNPKEKAEHATIVDLLRNDLSSVARKVRVKRYRYLERLATTRGELWQTSSHISGELASDWANKMGDILARLLPAGSVSGAPKSKTLDMIQDAEGQNRGYYTGIAGLFDGHQLDTCVMIRFIEQQGNGSLRYWSGGGITAQSDWEEEYAELLEKVYLPVPKLLQIP